MLAKSDKIIFFGFGMIFIGGIMIGVVLNNIPDAGWLGLLGGIIMFIGVLLILFQDASGWGD